MNKINYLMISPNFPENHFKYALALKNRGVDVIGIGDAYTHEIKDELFVNLTDYKQCLSLANTHQMILIIQKIKDQYGHIDFIESNNEFWLDQDSTLREWFDVKSGFYNSEISKYKAKSEMKKYFNLAHVKTSPYHLSDNLENTLKFALEYGYPLFLKPNIGVGAKGTKVIENENDIIHFYTNKPKEDFIFEKFMSGKIISFDGITNSRGDIIFSSSFRFEVLNDKIVNEELEDFYFCYKRIPKKISEAGRKIIKAFNIKSRCFHLEFFKLNKDSIGIGKKNDVIALEINVRSPGGYSPEIITASQGIDYYEVYADMICFDKLKQESKTKSCIAASYTRRERFEYAHSYDELKEMYLEKYVMQGEFDKAIKDCMGDSFIIFKCNSIKEANDINKIVKLKKV